MTSKFLSETLLPEDFTKDLAILTSSSADALDKLADEFAGLVSEDAGVREAEIASLQQEMKMPTGDLLRGLRITLFLQRGMQKSGDTAEDVVAELVDRGLLEAGDSDKILSYLQRAGPPWQSILASINRRSTYEKAFPVFGGMKTASVNIAAFEKEFNIDLDALDEYTPEVAEKIPAALINLRIIDGDDEQRVAFLATQEHINTMISFLQFTQKQLDCLTLDQSSE